MTGAAPVKVEHGASTLAEAIHEATTQLERLVGRQLRTIPVTGLATRP